MVDRVSIRISASSRAVGRVFILSRHPGGHPSLRFATLRDDTAEDHAAAYPPEGRLRVPGSPAVANRPR